MIDRMSAGLTSEQLRMLLNELLVRSLTGDHTYALCRCDKENAVLSEILRQLDAVRAGDISDYEFESARRYLRSSLSTGMDSPGRLDDFYIGQLIAGQPDTMQALSERIARVTKDDVAAAARRVSLDTVFFLKGVQA